MSPSILNSDILSELIKFRNVSVREKALEDSHTYGPIALSAMTRYEIIRGYKGKNASTQLSRFMNFCQHSLVLPVTDSIFDRASDLWAIARSGGYPCNDADLIIAATALEHGRTLVTGNTSHFSWISELTIEDWRQL